MDRASAACRGRQWRSGQAFTYQQQQTHPEQQGVAPVALGIELLQMAAGPAGMANGQVDAACCTHALLATEREGTGYRSSEPAPKASG